MQDGDRQGDERRWHAAVLGGDAAAWRAGYDAAFNSVRAYIHWRCAGLADLAEDVVQETWLTAVRRIGDYRPERGSFTGWVCGIAGNTVRNALRSRRRNTTRIEALVGDCPGPGPDGARRDRSERTARALADLPPHYESALSDKYVHAKTVADMAAARGESIKAVESLLSRARDAFREAYERLGDDDG